MEENKSQSIRTNYNDNADIREVLTEELRLFRTIFSETNQFVEDLDNFSVSHLMTLLENRKRWIEELKLLKTRRNSLKIDSQEDIKKDISNVLCSLISIDAKILDLLKSKQKEIIKDLVKITDNKHRNKKSRSFKSLESKVIDIMQE